MNQQEERAERYRDLYLNAQAGLSASSLVDGKVIECNDWFAKLVGRLKREECLDQSVVPERAVGSNVWEEILSRLRDEGGVSDFEVKVGRVDGSFTWLSYSAWRVPGSDQFECVVSDISKRKRLEEDGQKLVTHLQALEAQIRQVQQMDEVLGVLVGGIAHDFNNRLTSILGNASMALSKLPLESPVREMLQRVEKGTLKAADVTNKMLAYSAKDRFAKEPKVLDKLIDEITQRTALKIWCSDTAPSAETRSEESIPPESWRGSGTVLVVDDDESVISVARQILEHAGFTVLTAGNGREGVQAFRAHAEEVVAVLLDVVMPVLDGEATCREILQLDGNARVILMSGYDEQGATHGLTATRLAGFIQKPFLPLELIGKLREVLEESRSAELIAATSESRSPVLK